MNDKRILMLAGMVDMSTNVTDDKATVTATLRKTGLQATTTWKAGKEQEVEAGARALTTLLGKLDTLADIHGKLGSPPAKGAPRGAALNRMRAAQAQASIPTLPGPDIPGTVTETVTPSTVDVPLDDPSNGIDLEIDL